MQNHTSFTQPTGAPHRELPAPNPITRARHRRDVFRQITLPFLIGLLVFAAFVVFVWIATTQQASLWADIALIFLITLLGFATFFFLILSAILAYAIIAANRGLPPYARLAQDKLETVRKYVRRYSDRAASPIINTQSRIARLSALAEQLRLRRKRS